MKRWLMVAATGTLATLSDGSAASAQVRSIAEELRINVHASAARLDDDAGDDAPGIGGSLGYAASRWFMPFITLDIASMENGGEEFRMRHLGAGVRVHVRGADARLVPFVLAALTWRSASYEDRFFLGEVNDVRISGEGITLGAGALYYLRPRFALELSGKWTGGDMSSITVEGFPFRRDEYWISGSSMRVNFGLSVFPTGPAREGER